MTIRDYFDQAVAERPEGVFQVYHDGVTWATRTYAQVYQRVIRAAAVIRALTEGHQSDDGYAPRCAIMLENCPDWQVLYLAITGAGFVVVPLDPKLRATETAHILRDSGAICVFAASKQRAVLEKATDQNPIQMIFDFEARFDRVTEDEYAAAEAWYQARKPQAQDLASLIYTSGTTGKPKGAMLTHGNFTANCEQTLARVPFYSTDNFLNVLPLFHAFSFMANFILPLRVQATTSFMQSLRTIASDLVELKPTILLAVPLLAEKLYARIESKIQKSIVATGLMKFNLSRKFVVRKIMEGFGGRMRLIGIGGAPTAHATLKGFQDMGLEILEGYGITECSPGVAYPVPGQYVIGTVGPIISGMEYKIVNADDTGAGELYVKGPNVTAGYWRNPEQTAAAFDENGFYKTGDIVREDAKGNISICGRTKALIVNREGKNIYPEEIEQALDHAPLIKDAIVLGYHVRGEVGEHVGAIIVPDEDAVKEHLKRKVLTRDELVHFIREYAFGVCRASVADYKLPRKFRVLFEPLERTPSMKVRRVVYAGTLDEDPVVAPPAS